MMTVAAPATLSAETEVPALLRRLLAGLRRVVPSAYLVGGAVRDLASGRHPVDLDVVTTGDPAHAADAIARWLRGHAFALDAERGHHRVVMEDGAVSVIDVSQAADVVTDLARRDYTVDAMAAPILEDGGIGQIIDPFGGLADLDGHVVRMLTPANLKADPLRLLRAARIATELDMRVEDGTALAIRSLAPAMDSVAGERVRDELARIFGAPRTYEGVRLLDSLGLLDVILPELAPARGVGQPEQHHYYDVFEHSLHALASIDEMLHDQPTKTDREWLGPLFREGIAVGLDLDAYMAESFGSQTRLSLTKFATLLHDVSKPETKSVEADGRMRFLGHPEQGAVKARAICNRLRFGSRETHFVSLLVEEHLRPTMLAGARQLPSRRALYRFFRDLGEAAPACLTLSLADAAGATGPRLQPERWRGHVAYAAHVLAAEAELNIPVEKTERLISGRDLIEVLGMEPGPELGRVLDAIDEAIAVGEIKTRAEAIEYARGKTPPPAPSPQAERGKGDDTSFREADHRWQADPGAWEQLKPRARELRRDQTPSEDRLWQALRANRLNGLSFRRQHVIGRYIADFYCREIGLVIEVDGPVHRRQVEDDQVRQEIIEDRGLTVLRFTDDEVIEDLPGVLARILTATNKADPGTPSPPAGRGQGEGFP